MYRVFESLDSLVQTVEQAYGVPMTSNCMVPRNEVLALLDDLRNALPMEIDDAQDVLDKRDEVIANAEKQAYETITSAEAEANSIINNARGEADAMLEDAQQRATTMVSRAEDDAHATITRAREDSEDMVARAQEEANRLVRDGNESYQRSIDEGLTEQQRLVSEAEVVLRADEEARRIVDAAHIDSTKLRTECDQYVDGKLAEFEESLSGVLRTVSRDRAALRRGAGAGGVETRLPSRGGEWENDRGYSRG
ncbi:ATP synthase F0 subunit B [Corynebacterium caspium]|uniref:ATP synthase F0 subunit B n=1 Tax=Corynebacterium caspium TaxID=234828 RepID=UPI00037DC8EE|nr:DivIVA domain-containing protein [Corynebacterium caspium]